LLDSSRRALYLALVRVRDVLGPESRLRGLLPGYQCRPGQLAMAEAVERALEHDRPLFVEAGTGTGKTLAYLVPALLSGRKVVVSTATKALQEQIFTKDLPLVAKVLAPHGITFRAALMKGLSNYVCRRRFEELKSGSDAPEAVRRHLPKLEAWVAATESGDRAEVADVPEDAEIWREVLSSSETRIGAECRHFDRCFVTQMRREAEQAELVVVNHHLFLADLALRTSRSGDYASAIPAYDAVVFDEAHQLEEIATEFFGVRISSARVEGLVRDAHRAFVAAGFGGGPLLEGHTRGLLDAVEQSSRAFFVAIRAGGARPHQGDSRRVLAPTDWTAGVRAAASELEGALERLQAFAKEHAERDGEDVMVLVERRARELRTDLEEVRDAAAHGSGRDDTRDDGRDDARDDAYDDDGQGRSTAGGRDVGQVRRVTWVDVRERSVSVGSSPIDVGPTLRSRLFDRVSCVICTSATLATHSAAAGASFHFSRARLGAPPWTEELVVSSPFDFGRCSALYVPRDLPEPGDPTFEPAAAGRIAELVRITDGGAFVLCTSNRAMKALYTELSRRFVASAASGGAGYPLFVQGEAPKHLLLSRFRSSGRAVLVATMSFWEGVDVPGWALRLVVIDKIPFAVPTDPVVMARSDAIEREGGNAFAQYAVPSAAITLKQGFGRLLRTERDAGIVAVLDRRLLTKGYGRMLVSSLPPARRAHSLDDVRQFWSGLPERLSAGLAEPPGHDQVGVPTGPTRPDHGIR
jgi:ATP-dependent DNA helicase DinG